MKTLPRKYTPNSFARTFLYGQAETEFTVKIKGEKDKRWAYIYVGRKKVWSCNYEFFKAHFAPAVKR